MRFHVLGVGPIGSLVAFHLRRALPSVHPISLVVKSKRRARELRAGGGIAIEHGGVAVTQGGYDVEVFDPLEEAVYDLVYNKGGQMRLPSGTAKPWRRVGELDTTTSMGVVQRPIESLIVCTKAHSTLPVFHRIKQRITPMSTIVLLQNGMGVYESLISEVFRNPLERPQFLLATTTHAARSKLHGNMIHTVHTGSGDLSFGILADPVGERDFEQSKFDRKLDYYDRALSLDDIAPASQDEEPRDRCASLRETIAALNNLTDLKPEWLPMSELHIRLKRKLVINSCINPLSSITQSSNGALFAEWHARSLVKKVCLEAAAVFAAEAADASRRDSTDTLARTIEAPIGLRAPELEGAVYNVARSSSQNFSSMLQDLWKGRNTEIEYLNGYLHRLGKKFGVPTPINDTLYQVIKMREKVVPAARL